MCMANNGEGDVITACVSGYNCERVRVMTVGGFINHKWCTGLVALRWGVFNDCEGGGVITARGIWVFSH